MLEVLLKHRKVTWIWLYIISLVSGLVIRLSIWLFREIPKPGSSYLLSSHNIFNVVFANNCFLWFTPCYVSVSWLLLKSRINKDDRYTDPEDADQANFLPLTAADLGYHPHLRTNGNLIFLQTAKMILIYLWVGILRVWCFGNSLFDRYLIHTGGHCVFDEASPYFGTSPNYDTCVSELGVWDGGVKFSGHMLVLGTFSLMLIYELRNYAVIRSLNEQDNTVSISKIQFHNFVFSIEDAVVGFSAFVLLMWYGLFIDTAIFFHTTTEKVVGLACALAVPYLLYIFKPTKKYFSVL
ncbi:unnamed protein product [Kuraishia capsulata CBS 1993]|uniref:Uncharacterized protein n=1 Tax=Kuraishia capsulata CBS 1993 TaxID=1382522 RepID=W6MTM3_9ASCO|nr:uncharacterized protein KUCA_T00001097001 [Kuraishia capsulata CBS 1993]CDK25130.1 unnamed protein product [Kuraishia capsulata CBS 1993]